MSFLRLRMGRILERLGEPLVIDGSSRPALVSTLSASQARNWIDPLVVDGLSRPIWSAIVAHDDPAELGDEGGWPGVELTVRGLVPLRMRGETFAVMLVLA